MREARHSAPDTGGLSGEGRGQDIHARVIQRNTPLHKSSQDVPTRLLPRGRYTGPGHSFQLYSVTSWLQDRFGFRKGCRIISISRPRSRVEKQDRGGGLPHLGQGCRQTGDHGHRGFFCHHQEEGAGEARKKAETSFDGSREIALQLRFPPGHRRTFHPHRGRKGSHQHHLPQYALIRGAQAVLHSRGGQRTVQLDAHSSRKGGAGALLHRRGGPLFAAPSIQSPCEVYIEAALQAGAKVRRVLHDVHAEPSRCGLQGAGPGEHVGSRQDDDAPGPQEGVRHAEGHIRLGGGRHPRSASRSAGGRVHTALPRRI